MISVGDTVHVTDDALKMTTWKHRKEFKVTKVSYDSFGNQWVQGSALFEVWKSNDLEECAMKFKVGDKVRIVGNSFSEHYDSHEFNIGDIVTVEDVLDDNNQPYYCKDSDGHMWWVTEDDIEKAEDKTMKFKVGDKVRITDRGIFRYNYRVGDTAIIENIHDDLFVLSMRGGGKQNVLISHADEYIEKVEDKTMKFKVGDKVVIKSKAEIAKAYGDADAMPGGWVESMDKYCGKTGEVVDGYADRINVIFNDSSHWNYGAKALTPAASTVTITFNGDATTATDGEHTATVTKYHDDEYSKETGAIEAIKKLYHRFPQVGDEYCVVYVDKTGATVDFHGFVDDAIDETYRKSGNFYETKAAAQKAADKINAIFKEEH